METPPIVSPQEWDAARKELLVEEDDRRRQLKVTRPLTSFDCLCYGGYFGTPQRQSLEALGSLDRAA